MVKMVNFMVGIFYHNETVSKKKQNSAMEKPKQQDFNSLFLSFHVITTSNYKFSHSTIFIKIILYISLLGNLGKKKE